MTRDELAEWWRVFGVEECRGYSPLYEAICARVATADELLDRLLGLPDHVQQPNMLLAAVHDRVLRGDEPDLAGRYDAGDPDVGPAFVTAALEAWDELVPVLERRRTQTNEVGRVATLAPAIAALDLREPPTIVDVGTSAGLTLTLDHCSIDYGPHGRIGPVDSPVTVACDVLHGSPPVTPTPVARRIGLDRNPLDPADPDDARWLLACTWPDTGRLERTRAALELAASLPLELRPGDAVDALPAVLAEIDGPVVVTTTWVLAYLPPPRRRAFAEVLAAASRDRPVHHVSAEGPGVVDGLPSVHSPAVDGPTPSVLGVVSNERGTVVDARVLAHVHAHGRWLWWHD